MHSRTRISTSSWLFAGLWFLIFATIEMPGLIYLRQEGVFASLQARSNALLAFILGLVFCAGVVSWSLWRRVEARRFRKELAERRERDEQLRKLSRAVEQCSASIVITDLCGRIEYVNPKFCEVTGYSLEEVRGQNPRLLKSGEMPPEGYQQLWKTILTGREWRGEFHNRRKDGQLYWEAASISPIVDEAGRITHFVGVKEDITGRKQMEADLTHERDMLDVLLKNTPDTIYFKDLQSRFVRASDSFKTLLKLPSLDLLIGKTDFDLFTIEHAQPAYDDEQEIIRTGKPIICKRERETHPDGRVTWALTSKMPWRDKQGTTIGTIGISKDITDMKQAEAERDSIEAQLRQAQKLEAIGRLAAGISHEINTPIQYVGDNTRFLQDAFNSLQPVLQSHEEMLQAVKNNSVTPEIVDRAQSTADAADVGYLFQQIPAAVSESLEGVGRITKIVRAMKEFSHPGGKERAVADLNKAVESTATVARNEWKYVADLELELDPGLPPVSCFLGEFNQAILNLIINAAHAVADAIKQKPDAKGLISVRTCRHGDMVEVRVSDTGTGIPDSVRPHIFEPFFTTKPVGKGTGQGLAIVYSSIVTKHGGTVAFESEPGKGTTFILRLPIAPPATPDAGNKTASTASPDASAGSSNRACAVAVP